LLFEHASVADFQKLLTSEVDACVPLFVSPDTLVSTLDLVMTRDVRVMVVADAKRLAILPGEVEEQDQPQTGVDNLQSCGNEHEAIPITTAAMRHSQPAVNGTGTVDLDANDSDTLCAAPLRNLPKLSEREAQILDGLVKGHANKVIARMCGITEATVKVHMKSILRKIHVVNRTQAAIWALENGYPPDEIKSRELKAASLRSATAIM
jgi:two-component system nitrate/nitrite response regulator NarL